jgi:chaperonin GroES
MSFHPLGARIVVIPDDPEGRTKGGLIIPDSAKKSTGTGRVHSIGPGMLKKDGTRWAMPDLQPGDRVVFSADAVFSKTEIDGQKVLMMRDDDVLAVLEP